MIRGMIFDLDGTLVQTEELKARSYAQAVAELTGRSDLQQKVVDAYQEVVGQSRHEVANHLVERFELTDLARKRTKELGVSEPWQAFVQVRLGHYERMLADPELIRKHRWPHTMALLAEARRVFCKVGLATMSYHEQARQVLEALDLVGTFDFVASRDDVEHGKPDPEIDLLVAHHLQVEPGSCLVIEDSASGVEAAQAAGMHCIAVATPFTRRGLHEAELAASTWLVEDPKALPGVLRRMIEEHQDEPDAGGPVPPARLDPSTPGSCPDPD